jgi:hypothetical protein
VRVGPISSGAAVTFNAPWLSSYSPSDGEDAVAAGRKEMQLLYRFHAAGLWPAAVDPGRRIAPDSPVA